MNMITSLLTISLLIVVPSCGGRNNCKATYIDTNNELQTEQLASDDAVAAPNVKC
jgi:hypothetical protein